MCIFPVFGSPNYILERVVVEILDDGLLAANDSGQTWLLARDIVINCCSVSFHKRLIRLQSPGGC